MDTSYFSASFLPSSGFFFVASSSGSKLNLTTFCAALSTVNNCSRMGYGTASEHAYPFFDAGSQLLQQRFALRLRVLLAGHAIQQSRSLDATDKVGLRGCGYPFLLTGHQLYPILQSLTRYTGEVASDMGDHCCLQEKPSRLPQ